MFKPNQLFGDNIMSDVKIKLRKACSCSHYGNISHLVVWLLCMHDPKHTPFLCTSLSTCVMASVSSVDVVCLLMVLFLAKPF